MSIPLGVLTNKITHEVQWSKLTYLQPILTFFHSNICPSTLGYCVLNMEALLLLSIKQWK